MHVGLRSKVIGKWLPRRGVGQLNHDRGMYSLMCVSREKYINCTENTPEWPVRIKENRANKY